MKKESIQSADAPRAIGPYSQAVRVGNAVYLSGQIGLEPATMEMADGLEAQIHRVFRNLTAVTVEAGGSLQDVVKLNIYLTDLDCFARVNEIMASYFDPPYPARATIGVASLPRSALIEIDAIIVVSD